MGEKSGEDLRDFMKKRPLMKGVLTSSNDLKDRWFVLRHPVLAYHEGTFESGPKKLKGEVRLSSIVQVEKVEDEREFPARCHVAFQVIIEELASEKPTRILYILATSLEQRDKWIHALREEVKACNIILRSCYHPRAFNFQQKFFNCCLRSSIKHPGCAPSHQHQMATAAAASPTPVTNAPATPLTTPSTSVTTTPPSPVVTTPPVPTLQSPSQQQRQQQWQEKHQQPVTMHEQQQQTSFVCRKNSHMSTTSSQSVRDRVERLTAKLCDEIAKLQAKLEEQEQFIELMAGNSISVESLNSSLPFVKMAGKRLSKQDVDELQEKLCHVNKVAEGLTEASNSMKNAMSEQRIILNEMRHQYMMYGRKISAIVAEQDEHCRTSMMRQSTYSLSSVALDRSSQVDLPLPRLDELSPLQQLGDNEPTARQGESTLLRQGTPVLLRQGGVDSTLARQSESTPFEQGDITEPHQREPSLLRQTGSESTPPCRDEPPSSVRQSEFTMSRQAASTLPRYDVYSLSSRSGITGSPLMRGQEFPLPRHIEMLRCGECSCHGSTSSIAISTAVQSSVGGVLPSPNGDNSPSVACSSSMPCLTPHLNNSHEQRVAPPWSWGGVQLVEAERWLVEWEAVVESRRPVLVRHIDVDEVVSPLSRSGVISAYEEARLRAAPSNEEARQAASSTNEELRLHAAVSKQELFVNLLLRKTHNGVLHVVEAFRQVGHSIMASLLEQMLDIAMSKATVDLCVSAV